MRRRLRHSGLLACVVLLGATAQPAGTTEANLGSTHHAYPGQHWSQVKQPEDKGWSSERLAAAKTYADTLDTAAVMIVDDGVIIYQWGQTTTKFNIHSIRKSFLSALYGIAVAKGEINLDATLEQLGIDDNEPSLTQEEKQARVIDLLKARSGIYHAALYETATMKAEKPARGSHPPRTFWSYNNWDFNALGTIYENMTHDTVYHAFQTQIARRVGMEDYDFAEQEYVTGPDSIHRAYPFRMSARDMARFGLLYLRAGTWRATQSGSRGLGSRQYDRLVSGRWKRSGQLQRLWLLVVGCRKREPLSEGRGARRELLSLGRRGTLYRDYPSL